MRFLKALQKNDEEPRLKPQKVAAVENRVASLDAKMPDLSDPQVAFGKVAVDIQSRDAVKSASNGTHDLLGDNKSNRTVHEYRQIDVHPERVNPCLVSITEPNSSSSEEYRNVRTAILQKGKRRRLSSIVVTSVAPGEGKSVTAMNLAWLLAQSEGIKTILIDCDLRLPSLAGYVGIEPKPGLSEVLDGESSLSDSIVQLNPSGLFLLPGGRARRDVAELLTGPTFAKLMDEVIGMFDYVIVDAPPIGVFTDAKILVHSLDATLMVIRRNFTHYKALGRIMEDLPADRLLGAVMNDSDEPLIEGEYYDYRY
ncbi:MAG TPA: CpsD/CapB family tyrosine-protein kinase [Pyrinomonadaceae bacterium]|nr:CpsD/CapB family tyrosine-protein kinase [Pyrinomonadaceae bacterium]